MISNYKFQDLAQLVDDLKFLMARGGGSTDRLTKVTAFLNVVSILFWHVLKFVIVVIILYTVYHLVFKGYPRFPVDLFKWKFYNRINVKSEVGTNQLLYNHINQLATDKGLAQALDDYSTLGVSVKADGKNVYNTLFNRILKHYSVGFRDDKDRVATAFQDYFAYYDVITDKLGFGGSDIATKRTIASMLKQTVLENYVKIKGLPSNFMAFYDILMDKELSVLCLSNDGKDGKKRDQISKKKRQLKANINELTGRYNIVKVETVKNFAKKFLDPEFTLNEEKNIVCTRRDNAVNDELMSNPMYIELQKEKQSLSIQKRKLDKKMKGINGKNRKNKNKRRDLETQLKNIEEQIKKMEATASKKAEGAQEQQNTIRNPVQFNSVDDLLSLKDKQPDATSTPDTSKYFSVFVPCYDLYSQYYHQNRSKYQELENTSSNSDRGLTEKEIIAYIFLNDLRNINERKTGNKISDDIVIEKIIDIYMGVEEVVDASRRTLFVDQKLVAEGNVPPKCLLQFIPFPNDDTFTRSVAEFYRIMSDKKTALLAYDAYKNDDQAKFDSLGATEEYTYYLLELYYSSLVSPRKAFKQFADVAGVFYKQPNFVAFSNLPPALQIKPEIQEKMGVSQQMLRFMKHHPLFTWIYLHPECNTDNVYQQTLGLYYNGMFGLSLSSKIVGKISFQNTTLKSFQQQMKQFQDRIHNMKKVIVTSQMIELFFVAYRDDVLENNRNLKKTKVAQSGLVSLYNEQNISYNVEPFFKRLFKPFRLDFIEGRIFGTWKRTFNGFFRSRNHPNSFWREFKALYIDWLGKIMDQMLKSFWKKLRSVKT